MHSSRMCTARLRVVPRGGRHSDQVSGGGREGVDILTWSGGGRHSDLSQRGVDILTWSQGG